MIIWEFQCDRFELFHVLSAVLLKRKLNYGQNRFLFNVYKMMCTCIFKPSKSKRSKNGIQHLCAPLKVLMANRMSPKRTSKGRFASFCFFLKSYRPSCVYIYCSLSFDGNDREGGIRQKGRKTFF